MNYLSEISDNITLIIKERYERVETKVTISDYLAKLLSNTNKQPRINSINITNKDNVEITIKSDSEFTIIEYKGVVYSAMFDYFCWNTKSVVFTIFSYLLPKDNNSSNQLRIPFSEISNITQVRPTIFDEVVIDLDNLDVTKYVFKPFTYKVDRFDYLDESDFDEYYDYMGANFFTNDVDVEEDLYFVRLNTDYELIVKKIDGKYQPIIIRNGREYSFYNLEAKEIVSVINSKKEKFFNNNSISFVEFVQNSGFHDIINRGDTAYSILTNKEIKHYSSIDDTEILYGAMPYVMVDGSIEYLKYHEIKKRY